jgi:hypothetical protein
VAARPDGGCLQPRPKRPAISSGRCPNLQVPDTYFLRGGPSAPCRPVGSRKTSLVIFDGCARSVSYGRTIFVGNWHTAVPLRRDGSADSPGRFTARSRRWRHGPAGWAPALPSPPGCHQAGWHPLAAVGFARGLVTEPNGSPGGITSREVAMHRLGIRCAEVAGVISMFRPIDAAPRPSACRSGWRRCG